MEYMKTYVDKAMENFLVLSNGKILKYIDIVDTFFDQHKIKPLFSCQRISAQYGVVLKNNKKVILHEAINLPLKNDEVIQAYNNWLDSIKKVDSTLKETIKDCVIKTKLREIADKIEVDE